MVYIVIDYVLLSKFPFLDPILGESPVFPVSDYLLQIMFALF